MNNKKDDNNRSTGIQHIDDVEKEFEGGCFDDIIMINVGGVDVRSSHQITKHDGEELSL